jgi:hypothetical protein
VSDAKHTPGPWGVYDHESSHYPGIESKCGLSVVVWGERGEFCGVRGRNAAEKNANARLIAAAPDLLEALQELATLPIARNYPEGPCLHRDDMEMVKKAIAKAKGGDQ